MSEAEDLFTIDSVPFQDFNPKPISVAGPLESTNLERVNMNSDTFVDLPSPQSAERSCPQKQHSLSFDPFDPSVPSNTSPDIFHLSQSPTSIQNQNSFQNFDFFDSVQTPPPQAATLDVFDNEVQPSATPRLAEMAPPQTHNSFSFDLFVDSAPQSPFDDFSSFDHTTKSEEFLPPQPALLPHSDPRPLPSSHPFDPFEDLSSPKSFEIRGSTATAPLNPFETDTYPVLTSSSPDPFFTLSIK